MKAVVATFIVSHDDEADDILDSLGMLAENNSYTLYMTRTRQLTSEEKVIAIHDLGFDNESD